MSANDVIKVSDCMGAKTLDGQKVHTDASMKMAVTGIDTEWLTYCIQVIGSTDKEDIESDGVEVYCEDENGIEGSLEESITERCAQAYELLKSQKSKIAELEKINSQLLQQAEGHAQEARTQKSIVLGIYQELGIQLGDWNGKSPVVAKFDELNRQLEAVRKANEDLAEQCKENDALKAQVNELIDKAFQLVGLNNKRERIRVFEDGVKGQMQCLAEVKAKALEDAAEFFHTLSIETHELRSYASHVREEAANAE